MGRLGDVCSPAMLAPGFSLAASAILGNMDTAGFRTAQVMVGVHDPAGAGADTLKWKVQHSPARPLVSPNMRAYDGTDHGGLGVNDAAGAFVKYAIPFTNATARTINEIRLHLSRLGVPALAAGNQARVKVTIDTEAAAKPAGAPVAVARFVDANAIGLAREEVSFVFDQAADLAAATNYWIVIEGIYDASDADCIKVHFNNVAGGCLNWDSFIMVPAWVSLAANAFWYEMDYLTYVDVPDACVTPVGDTTFTEDTITNDAVEGVTLKEVNLVPLGDFIRVSFTAGGGSTWTGGCFVNLGDPEVQPAR